MHGLKTLLTGSVLAASVSSGVTPSFADWPSTPTLGVPVCAETGTRDFPMLLADGCGGAYLAWADVRLGWPETRIHAQHLCALGNAAWDADGVQVSGYRAPYAAPLLVPDGSGGGFVVWSDFRADTAGNVYAQHFAPQQPALWGADGLPVSLGPLHERQLAAAPDGAGGFFVAWTDDRDGPDWQVYVQHVSAGGARLWGDAGIVAAPNAALQTEPKLVPDGAGGVIVAWTDGRGLMPNACAQRLSAAGERLWPASGTLLTTWTHSAYLTQLAADGRGGAFVAVDAGLPATSTRRARGQHVDPAGSLVWASAGLPLGASAVSAEHPRVCSDGAGGAFFAWSEYDAGQNDVFVLHVDSAATAPNSALVGRGADASHSFGFALAPDNGGGALLAWNSDEGTGYGLWVQRLDDLLTLAWDEGGMKAAQASGWGKGVAVVPDRRGGAIVAWRADDGVVPNGLYAARLDASGHPGTAGVPPAATPARLSLAAAPSPVRAGGTVTLRLALPAAGTARVTVLDLAGRRITALRGAVAAPGVLPLHWDGRDATGRRVPAGLYFARAEAANGSATARIVVTD